MRKTKAPIFNTQNKINFTPNVGNLTNPNLKEIRNEIHKSEQTLKVIQETIEKVKNDPTKQKTTEELKELSKTIEKNISKITDRTTLSETVDLLNNPLISNSLLVLLGIFIVYSST